MLDIDRNKDNIRPTSSSSIYVWKAIVKYIVPRLSRNMNILFVVPEHTDTNHYLKREIGLTAMNVSDLDTRGIAGQSTDKSRKSSYRKKGTFQKLDPVMINEDIGPFKKGEVVCIDKSKMMLHSKFDPSVTSKRKIEIVNIKSTFPSIKETAMVQTEYAQKNFVPYRCCYPSELPTLKYYPDIVVFMTNGPPRSQDVLESFVCAKLKLIVYGMTSDQVNKCFSVKV